MLFFREQHITPEQQLAFATRFGQVSVAPFGPKDAANPDITVLDQLAPKGEGADSWHADNTFMPEPPFASILRGERIPALGGDTCWANTYLAYEGLSAPVRDMIDGLYAVHDITKMLAQGHRDRQERRERRGDAGALATVPSPGRAHSSDVRAQGPVRQPQLDHPHRRAQRAREQPTCSSCSSARC